MSSTRMRANEMAAVARRVRWAPVMVSLMCMIAILWVLLRPEMWTSCLVVAVGALAIAVVGRDAR